MPRSAFLSLFLLVAALYPAPMVEAFAPQPMNAFATVDSHSSRRSIATTQLFMALDKQSPQVRKNVMSAAVSAAATPALLTVATPLVAAATTTLLATSSSSADASSIAVYPPLLGAGLFVGHWIVTNYVLQQFPDVGEVTKN